MNLMSEQDVTQAITFDSVLEGRVKFGRSQIVVYFGIGVMYFANGLQLAATGLVFPVISSWWNLSDARIVLLTSMFFTGWGVASVVAGKLSDRVGRR